MAFPLSSPSTPPLLPTAPAVDPVTGAFAQAINSMQPPRPLVSLSPALPRPSPSSSSTMPSTPNISVTSFSEVQPSALHNTLAADNTLILDIRPHNAYTLGRLPNALPMSVPSTLLKRPGFSLAKLCQMLPSVAARERFSDWQNADRILVYDADSSSLVEGGNLLGLLRKFRTEGYTRDVAFVKGGFHAVWREMPSLVDTQPPPREDDEDSLPAMTKSASAPSVAPALRTKQLPMSAFTLSSTAASSQPSLSLSQRRAMHHHSLSLSQSQSEMAFNPFFDNVRQNLELRGSDASINAAASGGIQLKLPRRVRRRVGDLPFEWLRRIARRSGKIKVRRQDSQLCLLNGSSVRILRLSPDSPSSSNTSEEDLTRLLASQFYKIELGEQRRLMGVMERHSKESGADKEGPGESEAAFPYSITAGIEKGTKNRYRNIWPFEHARVRLLRKSSNGEEDDYMNASYVQPLGTTKRYIATQGPLPATFNDFWTLCWEQNVHVIVMLTREVESASVKCGNYWNDGSYGALELKLVETNDTSERERKRRENELSSGFFNIPAQHGAKASKSRPNHKPDGASAEGEDEEATPHTIRRVFSLTHTGYPFVPPRTVIQLQYLEWPDMNVPDNCKGVLHVLPDSTEGARNDEDAPLGDSSRLDELDPKTGIARHAIGNPPVLLHCSAGVGRTGGFIAVDAVLDGIRREMRKRSESSRGQGTTSAGESYSGMDSGSEVMESSSPPRETSESRSSTNGDGTGEGEPMEVDSSNNSSPRPTGSSILDAPHMGIVSPVPQVPSKKGHRISATTASITSDDSASLSHNSSSRRSIATTGSASASASHFGSGTGSRTDSVEAGTASSTTSLLMMAKTAGLSLGDKDEEDKEGSPPQESKSRETVTADDVPSSSVAANTPAALAPKAALAKSPSAHTKSGTASSSRLDDWRSEVRNQANQSIQLPNAQESDGASSPEDENIAAAKIRAMAQPRRLHDNASPPMLSTYDSPVRRVVEDMRQQRMSLCQSLRQYVFVHRAIIEGALMIVDEEKERQARRGSDSPPSAPPSSSVASSPTTTLSPGRSKRGPSPTELLKQGTSGEVLLTKRPSIKRRQRSEDAEGAMLQVKHVHSASVSSPPPHAQ
ncbi:hypothetical protein BXZ70DRAFT_891438 [Cristinia sonorae]|uniref:protein-tyrosine-phosphatase n=1 Tax=Cristinia sonorae TaxID=1940300 RepID=A0A8K0XQS5_9AGAR|nr:hypothetical protein BXZ70DRAFT_891438 [Cristinia sonorae]